MTGGKRSGLTVLLFGDTHLGFDYPIKPRVTRRRRGADFFANYQRVLDFALKTRPDLVVHGGDFFFRSKVSPQIVKESYERLMVVAGAGIPVFIVPGNHERSRLPLPELLDHPGIHLFDIPRTFLLKTKRAILSLSGFPCERGDVRKRFTEHLEATRWQQYSADLRLLILHQAVEGASVGPSDFTFRNRKDTINLKDIPKAFAATLCGHIHRRQILTDHPSHLVTARKVIYPGSTERTSFAEREESKGFFQLDFTPDKRNTWSLDQARFIRLPSRPMVDLLIEGELGANMLEGVLRSRTAEIHPDAIIRLRLQNPDNNQQKAVLTGQFLRDILPDTMNYQYGTEFYRKAGEHF